MRNSMKKLSLILCLTVFVLAVVFLLPAKANAATVDDLSYKITNGEVAITDCNTFASGELVIPDTIDGYPVTSIGEAAFSWCESLTGITIPDGVTSIGDYAFRGCSSLTGITIPDSVISIGDYAFYNCSRLTSITIPDSVTSIGNQVFEACSSLIYHIYDNGKYLGNETNPCVVLVDTVSSDITECEIHPDTKIIYDKAFSSCSNLTSITIPDGVTSIGNSAFYDCSSLTSITIGDGVTSIGVAAFYNCSRLTYHIYDNGKYLGNENNPYIVLVDTVSSNITECEIHPNAKIIYYRAFEYCSNLTGITIPDGVTSIGDDAFSSCSSLTGITIPDSVTSIGSSAFYNCSSLTGITIGNGVTSIGSYAFSWCESLTGITIPDSVTSIGEEVFSGCSSLESIVIPFVGESRKTENDTYQYPLGYLFGTESYTGSIYTIQTYYIFRGVSTETMQSSHYYIPSTLRAVTVTGGNILYGAFHNCSNLTDVIICDGVNSINSKAFLNCTNLTSITIPDSVTSIGYYAFEGCSSLTNITIPDSVTSIGGYVFSGCSSLTTVIIGDGVTSIGHAVFSGCTSLKNVIIGDGVTNIEAEAFSDCYSLTYHIFDYGRYLGNENNPYLALIDVTSTDITEYEIHPDTKLIADSVFRDCFSLESVIIGDHMNSIGNYAFYNCISLESIIIGDHVNSIGNYAFYSCSTLESVVIPDSVADIGMYAFSKCISLTSVAIGNGVAMVGYSAFDNCDGLTAVYITDMAAWCEISFVYDYHAGYISSRAYCSNPLYYAHNLYLNGELVTDLVIPDGVTRIGAVVFYNCSSLTSITIPDSVTSIGYYAFNFCNNLTEVYIADIAAWCNISFYNYDSNPLNYAHNLYLNGELVTDLVIPDGVTSIGNYAFRGCSSLTSITIPDSVTSIGYYAFYNCSRLTGITIGDGVTSIDSSVFSDCSSLTSITIPDSVTSIGYEAFYSCSSLTSITIPKSVTSIGSDAFYGCSLNHVAYTGTRAFWLALVAKGNIEPLNSAEYLHFETSLEHIDTCTDSRIYCPVCDANLLVTVKEGGAHSYGDAYDRLCDTCDQVRTVAGMSVVQLPKTLSYPLFEGKLDVTGGILSLFFNNDTSGQIPMTADMVSGFDNSVIGVQQVKVSYEGFTEYFSVEVLPEVPRSLEISSLPDKLSYAIDDALDITGLTLIAHYAEGKTATVTAADVTARADMSSYGVKTATVTFQGVSVSFDIYVHERGSGEEWKTLDSSLYPESDHNYTDNLSETKIFNYPGALSLKITFNSSTNVESSYDHIYIYDGDGDQIAQYTGASAASATLTIPGDTFSVKLTSDGSEVRYGYAFSEIQANLGTIYHPEIVIPGYAATFARPGLTDGAKCSLCGEMVRPQQEIPQLVGKVAQWNMTLSDDLKVNFHLQISDEICDTVKIKMKIDGQTQTYSAVSLPRNEDGTYLLSANISAAQMNDDIVIVITHGGFITSSATYSANLYCDQILQNESHSAYHALVREMMHYGKMAKIYFDYNADDMADTSTEGGCDTECASAGRTGYGCQR